MTDALSLMLAYIGDAEHADPRAQQVASGASQADGCRAESLLRLLEVPQSNPDNSWSLESFIGKAAHSAVEILLAGKPGLHSERAMHYRGVKATVDVAITDPQWIIDMKFPGRNKVEEAREKGAKLAYRRQVHLGAAAAIEAGVFDEDKPITVWVCMLPRNGTKHQGFAWREPFNRKIADEAIDWLAEQAARKEQVAADLGDVLTATLAIPTQAGQAELADAIRPHLDGLRDEPLTFCQEYCPWVDTCRSVPEHQDAAIDPPTLAVVAEWVHLKTVADRAYARVKELQDLIPAVPGGIRIGDVVARWEGGNPKTVSELDVDQVREMYEFLMSQPAPMITKEVTTARKLMRRKVRAA